MPMSLGQELLRGGRHCRRRKQVHRVLANALALASAFASLAALRGLSLEAPSFASGFLPLRVGGPLSSGSPITLRAAAADYESMTVGEMKELLKERGLATTGRKAVLLERLAGAAPQAGGKPTSAESSEEDPPAAGGGAPAEAAAQGESKYLDDQGLMPDGKYMCLDGKARTGEWEKAKRDNPDDLNWLTEWVVAARTGQLEKGKAASKGAGKAAKEKATAS
mmetsp:Transcript_52651/g.85346  ORF Transcript_52651/g.85346 Transcript_52651/m.85346 type:complete len:222 (-) Transcript_52651:186-851(-)